MSTSAGSFARGPFSTSFEHRFGWQALRSGRLDRATAAVEQVITDGDPYVMSRAPFDERLRLS